MTSANKRKGDEAELRAAALLSELTGFNVKRKLGAGRAEDTGDIYGVPDHAIQVADWRDVLRAVWEKPIAAEQQRVNGNFGYAASMIWLPRRGFRVVLTPEQWNAYQISTQERDHER
jgi:hypothetical protein